MRPHSQPTFLLLATLCCLVGCAQSLYKLRIPLTEDPNEKFADAAHVTIEDLRPPRARTTHRGKDIWSCERWFGDDAFHPAKLVYLDSLIAERVTVKKAVHIRLDRFDTVEYCENSGNPGGSALARNAGAAGLPAFEAGAVVGNSVHLRMAGAVNGVPFDVSRTFDYGFIEYTFPEAPSSNYIYRVLLRSHLEQMADEIVKLIAES